MKIISKQQHATKTMVLQCNSILLFSNRCFERFYCFYNCDLLFFGFGGSLLCEFGWPGLPQPRPDNRDEAALFFYNTGNWKSMKTITNASYDHNKTKDKQSKQ